MKNIIQKLLRYSPIKGEKVDYSKTSFTTVYPIHKYNNFNKWIAFIYNQARK